MAIMAAAAIMTPATVLTGTDGHYATVTIVQDVAFPANAVWQVVGDWGNQDVGAGFVKRVETSGKSVGDTRTLFLSAQYGGGKVSERLEDYDALRMTYRYSLVDYGLVPWANYSARLTVAAVGAENARFVFEAKMIPAGVAAKEATAISVANMRAYLVNLDKILAARRR